MRKFAKSFAYDLPVSLIRLDRSLFKGKRAGNLFKSFSGYLQCAAATISSTNGCGGTFPLMRANTESMS